MRQPKTVKFGGKRCIMAAKGIQVLSPVRVSAPISKSSRSMAAMPHGLLHVNGGKALGPVRPVHRWHPCSTGVSSSSTLISASFLTRAANRCVKTPLCLSRVGQQEE